MKERNEVTSAEPPMPNLEDHPGYAAAEANVARLRRELAEVEAAYWQTEEAAANCKKRTEDRVEALIAGDDPDEKEAMLAAYRRDANALSRRRRDLGAAVAVARQRADVERGHARAAALRSAFVRDVYRPLERKFVLAWLATAQAWADLEKVRHELSMRDVCPPHVVPAWTAGDPGDETSWVNSVLGDMLVNGVLDATADATVLAGAKPYIPAPQVPPAPAQTPRTKKTLRQLMLELTGQDRGDW